MMDMTAGMLLLGFLVYVGAAIGFLLSFILIAGIVALPISAYLYYRQPSPPAPSDALTAPSEDHSTYLRKSYYDCLKKAVLYASYFYSGLFFLGVAVLAILSNILAMQEGMPTAISPYVTLFQALFE